MTAPDPARVVVVDAADIPDLDVDVLLRYAAIAPVAVAVPLSRVLSEYGRRGRQVAALTAALDRWRDLRRIDVARAEALSQMLRGMARRAGVLRRGWRRAAASLSITAGPR